MVSGTVYLGFSGVPDEACGECTIRFRSAASSYPVTSTGSGAYQMSVPPGVYQVEYQCPSPMPPGSFWVSGGSVTVPAVTTFAKNIVIEGCL